MPRLKQSERVSIHDAEARAIAALAGWGRPLPASSVADAIWPTHRMTPQGAGAAASRVLKRLEKAGQARWTSNRHGWGWVLSADAQVHVADPEHR